MADILIRHLKQKGGEHSALELLVNQWGFDQQLIPKALQSIGSLFPHYSRHDESHSKQILINIERLLGESIALLTATDTWLILEAAYWHDIGMVVPQSDFKSAIADADFKLYVQEIKNSPNHDLNRFCRSLDVADMSNCFNGASSPIEAIDQFRQLMAEWFRRKHPLRASNIVQSPWGSAGIQSPRTELIPARLFKLLGRICQMHGSAFDEILSSSGLPFREAGLAQEDCHPRFVACLLRMGDLLDLDDNRFCPVMQKIAGDNRPNLTKAHEDKHAGMRHLRIDRQYIEISAECSTIDGYLETFKWFDWLKQEMQDQMANWQNIVPNRDLGLLPTLGPISVTLSGELQVLSEGKRPQFTLDSKKATELLQGSNLYNDQFACIRELLQNSVDATLLRLWISNKGRSNPADWDTPDTAYIAQLFAGQEIKFSLREIELVNPTKSRWLLRIADEGTGISREDLTHMLRIGGSYGNKERQKLILDMPEWMKPSGVFGIGFQSVFLICDAVTVTTKSVFTNEALQLTLHSPTKEKEGLVLMRKLKESISHSCGTVVECEVVLDSSGAHGLSGKENRKFSHQLAQAFDPILSEGIPSGATSLADRVYEFSAHSPVRITGSLEPLNKVHSIIFDRVKDEGPDNWRWFFHKVGQHQVRLRYRPVPWFNSRRDSFKAYYRGQQFDARYFNLPCIEFQIDLLSGRAGSWLNASRDSIANRAREEFRDLVYAALESQIEQDLGSGMDCAWLTDDYKPVLSLFVEIMANRRGGSWISFAAKLNGEWKNVRVPSGDETYGDYLERKELLFESDYDSGSSRAGSDLSLPPGLSSFFLKAWLTSPNKSVCVQSKGELLGKKYNGALVYHLKSEPQLAYTDSALAVQLISFVGDFSTNRRYILRGRDNRWAKLYLKNDVAVRAGEVFPMQFLGGNRILLPFLFRGTAGSNQGLVEVANFEEICGWVQQRLAVHAPLEEVRLVYAELVNYIDEEIMAKSIYAGIWKKCRAKH